MKQIARGSYVKALNLQRLGLPVEYICSSTKLIEMGIWRTDRDSNPGDVAAYTLSKRAPSTTRPPVLVSTPAIKPDRVCEKHLRLFKPNLPDANKPAIDLMVDLSWIHHQITN